MFLYLFLPNAAKSNPLKIVLVFSAMAYNLIVKFQMFMHYSYAQLPSGYF